MSKKRIAQLVLVVAALSLFVILSKRWPKDRVFHFVLGDAAPRVCDVSIAYREGREQGLAGAEAARVATFHFAPGQAPRIVTHEARIADGDYTVEIEVASIAGGASAATPSTLSVERRVSLEGASVTTIDVSRDLARELANAPSASSNPPPVESPKGRAP